MVLILKSNLSAFQNLKKCLLFHLEQAQMDIIDVLFLFFFYIFWRCPLYKSPNTAYTTSQQNFFFRPFHSISQPWRVTHRMEATAIVWLQFPPTGWESHPDFGIKIIFGPPAGHFQAAQDVFHILFVQIITSSIEDGQDFSYQILSLIQVFCIW